MVVVECCWLCDGPVGGGCFACRSIEKQQQEKQEMMYLKKKLTVRTRNSCLTVSSARLRCHVSPALLTTLPLPPSRNDLKRIHLYAVFIVFCAPEDPTIHLKGARVQSFDIVDFRQCFL